MFTITPRLQKVAYFSKHVLLTYFKAFNKPHGVIHQTFPFGDRSRTIKENYVIFKIHFARKKQLLWRSFFFLHSSWRSQNKSCVSVCLQNGTHMVKVGVREKGNSGRLERPLLTHQHFTESLQSSARKHHLHLNKCMQPVLKARESKSCQTHFFTYSWLLLNACLLKAAMIYSLTFIIIAQCPTSDFIKNDPNYFQTKNLILDSFWHSVLLHVMFIWKFKAESYCSFEV